MMYVIKLGWATALCLGVTLLPATASEPMFAAQRQAWLEKAEAAKPKLVERTVNPRALVTGRQDPAAFQGWRMEATEAPESFFGASFKERIKAGRETVLDFGEHLTGYVTFALETIDSDLDGPLRLKFTFGEVPAELNTPFDPYPGGLSRAWLQDEIVTLTALPARVTIPRRVAFRYARIELLGISSSCDFRFTELSCLATTSASGPVEKLAPGTDERIVRIDSIGQATLRECMQTVYEDGPKRDRRLWIGDLYLEALSNAYTYKNHELTRRCLYLLAALANDEGVVRATMLEEPTPHPARNTYTMDYCLLYGVALHEYLQATGDRETALDLWPVARRQIEMARGYLDAESVYDVDKKPTWWLVFDWKEGYDRAASIQGLMTFATQEVYALAQALGCEKEVADWPGLVRKMKQGGRKRYYDAKAGVVVSGAGRQVSYLSQAWMILSGTLTPAEGREAMVRALATPGAVYPGSPYAWHYVIDAMIRCGMPTEARHVLMDYWGGMAELGADTFWEVYDPQEHLRSPYGFAPVNSYCHAWSCTPVYFIRKYPDVFQK